MDYAGINDFDLSSHIINQFSPRGTKVRSDSFELVSSSNTGVSSPLVCDRGEWVNGTIAGHYDRFSYNGSLWLCNVGKGTTTTEAPSDGNTAWIKQVEKGEDGEAPVELTIFSERGNILRNGQGETRLIAIVTKGGEDITNPLLQSSFSWTRNSDNEIYDKAWNNRHKGVGNIITISAEDVYKKAVFYCDLKE